MIHKVFAVRDNTAELYNLPYYAPTTGSGKRLFSDTVNDKTSMLAKHPDDFELFELGEYDDVHAEFISNGSPVSLGTARSFLTEAA